MTMGSNGDAVAAHAVPNPFRTRILSGQICPVISVKLITGNEIAMLCKMAGIPALFIDMEHSTLDLHAIGQLILACNFVGVSPLVRVPSKSPWHISRALDAGAAAVVVPHVETAAEARELVRAAKFAPLGNRGCTNSLPVMSFQHVPQLALNDVLNRDTMLIPMIETPGAVELAGEILAVDGVDGVLVGSNDLVADMGIPGDYDNPLYQNAVTKVVLAGKEAGKPVGIGGIGGRKDLLEKWFAMGASWSLSGQDLGILQAGMKKIGEDYRLISERLRDAQARESKK